LLFRQGIVDFCHGCLLGPEYDIDNTNDTILFVLRVFIYHIN